MLTNTFLANNNESLSFRLDQAIRFFLYVLLFWAPYSPAIIEICVVTSCILWIIKRATQMPREEFISSRIGGKGKYLLRAFTPVSTPLNFPIMLFVAACLLSVAGSAFYDIALRGFVTKTLEWFVIFYLVAETFNERRHLKTAGIILFVTSTSTFMDGLTQFYFLKKDIFCGREISRGGATAAFKHPNSLAAFCLSVIPLFYFYAKTFRKQEKMRSLFLLLTFMGIWCLAVTVSRAAWVSFVFISFIYFYNRFPKGRKYSLAALLVMLIAGTGVLFVDNANSRLNFGQFSGTVLWRRDLWIDTFDMIKDRPFFGHGINTFMMLFQEYRRKFNLNFYFSPSYAHNCYLQMAAEVGMLGLLAFLGILGAAFRQGRSWLGDKGPYLDSEIYAMNQGLWWGTIMFLTHSFFDVNFYSLQLSVLFWYILSLLIVSYKFLNINNFYVTHKTKSQCQESL